MLILADRIGKYLHIIKMDEGHFAEFRIESSIKAAMDMIGELPTSSRKLSFLFNYRTQTVVNFNHLLNITILKTAWNVI